MHEHDTRHRGIDRRTFLGASASTAVLGVGALTGTVGAQQDGGPSYVVEQGDACHEVTPLSTGGTVEEFYGYVAPHAHTTTDLERSDVSQLFLFDGPDGTSVVFLHDKPTGNPAGHDHVHGADTGGGAVSLDFTGLIVGEFETPVSDEPFEFGDWAWSEEHTDGGAFRFGGSFTLRIDPAFNEAADRDPLSPGSIDEWQLLSGDATDPDRIQLDLDRPVTIGSGPCGAAGRPTVDIKPGSDPNAINPRSRGVVPVAVLGSDDFDPVSRLDASSLRFGDISVVDGGGGARPVHGGHADDVDGDGNRDLVLHFPTRDADLASDAESGFLVGETVDGEPIVGVDDVRIVGDGGNGGPPGGGPGPA